MMWPSLVADVNAARTHAEILRGLYERRIADCTRRLRPIDVQADALWSAWYALKVEYTRMACTLSDCCDPWFRIGGPR